jgi:hypothetical protein
MFVERAIHEQEIQIHQLFKFFNGISFKRFPTLKMQFNRRDLYEWCLWLAVLSSIGGSNENRILKLERLAIF